MIQKMLQSKKNVKTTLMLFAIIALLLVVLRFSVGLLKEMFVATPEYLNYKSKCFSCEQEVLATQGEDAVWMANPTKLFAAEKDGVYQAGGDLAGGYLGKTMKYY